jgi:UDP-N-acetylglucosamine transferase subunit ALG13
MIFVTVGSMLAFDRLIRAMDQWAKVHSKQDVLAQIGSGTYRPSHMRWTPLMPPRKFQEAVKEASLLVAHAWMGSFFVAMEMRKPIVMLPRLASNRELTTDHQLNTVQWLGKKPGVFVATSEDELANAIDQALRCGNIAVADFQRFAPEAFLTKIRQFLVE